MSLISSFIFYIGNEPHLPASRTEKKKKKGLINSAFLMQAIELAYLVHNGR